MTVSHQTGDEKEPGTRTKTGLVVDIVIGVLGLSKWSDALEYEVKREFRVRASRDI